MQTAFITILKIKHPLRGTPKVFILVRQDPNFHVLVLDGIYVMDGKGEPVFRRVPPPTDKEVAHVAERIHRRVARLMQKRGLGPQSDPDEADGLRHD